MSWYAKTKARQPREDAMKSKTAKATKKKKPPKAQAATAGAQEAKDAEFEVLAGPVDTAQGCAFEHALMTLWNLGATDEITALAEDPTGLTPVQKDAIDNLRGMIDTDAWCMKEDPTETPLTPQGYYHGAVDDLSSDPQDEGSALIVRTLDEISQGGARRALLKRQADRDPTRKTIGEQIGELLTGGPATASETAPPTEVASVPANPAGDKGQAFRIDPEFQAIGRKLTEEEDGLLEASLKEFGCIDPIVTWDGIVVDGHNRFRLCSKIGIAFKTHEIMLVDRQAAREWIIDHQLGKRNLTDEEKAYYRGLRYNEEKNPHGGQIPGSGHNAQSSTAKQLAEKHGVDEKTIRRDAEFSEAVDALAEVDPEIKGEILSGKSGLTKKAVVETAAAPTEERAAAIAKAKAPRKTKTRKEPDPEQEPDDGSSDPMDVAYRETRNKVNAAARTIDKVKEVVEVLLKEVRQFKDKCKKSKRMDLHTKISEKLLRITSIGDYIRSRTCGVDLALLEDKARENSPATHAAPAVPELQEVDR